MMRKSWPRRLAVASLACCLGGNGPSARAQELSKAASQGKQAVVEDVTASPNGKNWTSYNGDYSGQRYSSLSSINATNASHLRAAWIFHADNTTKLEVTPVVYNGVMYVTAANTLTALDARTGRELWKHERAVSSGLLDDAAAHKNRGVGLWRNRVYMETDDARLLCMDSRSGRLLWDVTFADIRKGYGATSAPLVVKDEVIVGSSGGDSGVRGFLSAFDAETGTLRWKFWTIPSPGEPGSSSWPGDAYLHGGATTWMPGTYDPELNLLYWTTSNPAPDFAGESRPGDDLYTDCVLAIDADTGKLKWYFQFTPHDLFDYDANETPVLIDVDDHGVRRKLLVQANRNGFLYFLDRTNGKFLKATRFLNEVTWAKGIDDTGRPNLTGLIPTPDGTRICPGIEGATNWYSPSYNPAIRMFYFLALENCDMFFSKPSEFKEGETYYSTGTKRIQTAERQKILLAYSIPDGTQVWRYPQIGKGTSWAGTLATAGGVVFFGDDSGSFAAVDARTGHPLWDFNTGQTIRASPMSYEVDGVQYVALAAGSTVVSFSLPH
ncbi:MAG: PQQ-dependent dehydrogenase, methanol/ethanol family [Acidobacteria bacterium]|nr:PQQ-dependent dehydrogenase, methanol/ethanol family [Acidobacteriota bacterium]